MVPHILQRRRDTGTLATLFRDILATKGTFTAGQLGEMMSIADRDREGCVRQRGISLIVKHGVIIGLVALTMTVPALGGGGGGGEDAPQIASSAWLQPMTRFDLADAQETPPAVADSQTPTTAVSSEELTTRDASTSEPDLLDAVESWATMVIRPGDTLFDLADWFGVQPVGIAEANGTSLESFIVAGETLVVPVPQSAFVLPPEPALPVAQVVDVTEQADQAILVDLAETDPAPVIVAPPGSSSGYEGDVLALICALPWPCAQMVAIAACESGLDPLAFNPAGYYGLFQISFVFEGWDDPAINALVAYEQKYLPALAAGDPFWPWPLCGRQ